MCGRTDCNTSMVVRQGASSPDGVIPPLFQFTDATRIVAGGQLVLTGRCRSSRGSQR